MMTVLRKRMVAAATCGAAIVALGGCATETASGVQVTRFHLAQPIATGDISIEPRPGMDANSPEFGTYAAAVAPQLQRIGFTVLPSIRQAELVATVDVSRGERIAPPRARSSISFGIGGGDYGYRGGVGGGAGVTLPVGSTRGTPVVGTMLSVQLKRRSDGTVIWEGRAATQAPVSSPDSSPGPTVTRLANALFQGFPGESGRTITVK